MTEPCLMCEEEGRSAGSEAGSARQLCAACAARVESGPLSLARQYPPVRALAQGAPTPYPPGSAGKVAVLAWRYEHQFCLWHPLDGRLGPPRGAPGDDGGD